MTWYETNDFNLDIRPRDFAKCSGDYLIDTNGRRVSKQREGYRYYPTLTEALEALLEREKRRMEQARANVAVIRSGLDEVAKREWEETQGDA